MAVVKPIYLTAAGGIEEADPATDTISGPLLPSIVKTLSIYPPASGDNELFLYTDRALTISNVRAVLIGGGTSVALTGIYHATTRNSGSPNTVISSQTIDSFSTGVSWNTFSDPTVPANSWIWCVLGTVTGAVDGCTIAITYSFD